MIYIGGTFIYNVARGQPCSLRPLPYNTVKVDFMWCIRFEMCYFSIAAFVLLSSTRWMNLLSVRIYHVVEALVNFE